MPYAPPVFLGPLLLQRREIRVLLALGAVQSVDDSVRLLNAALEHLALVFVANLNTADSDNDATNQNLTYCKPGDELPYSRMPDDGARPG